MVSFVLQPITLLRSQALDLVGIGWVLGDERTTLEEIQLVHEAFLLGKGLDIEHEVFIGNVAEGIGDSVISQYISDFRNLGKKAHFASRFLFKLIEPTRECFLTSCC